MRLLTALALTLLPGFALAQSVPTSIPRHGPFNTSNDADLLGLFGLKLDTAGVIFAPVTWTVCASGCNYTDPVTAGYAAVAVKRLNNAIITIQIADGTYTEPNQFYTQCACGAFVQFIGDTANPAAVVLNFTGGAGTNLGGFVASDGGQIGLVDGLTINQVGAQTVENSFGTYWVPQSYGAGVAAAGGGSFVGLGSHLFIHSFYYGVVADDGGMVRALQGGVTATDAGDVDFMARGNGVIVCNGCVANRAADNTPGGAVLGACFDAERGGALYVDGSTCSNHLVGGIVGLTGGHIWGHQLTVGASLTGTGNGANIWEYASAELGGSTFSGANVNCLDITGYADIGPSGTHTTTCTGASGDGIVSDGGTITGSNVSSKSNGGYGLHALHQGKMIIFNNATPALLTGNTSGPGAADPAGVAPAGAWATYAASSLNVN